MSDLQDFCNSTAREIAEEYQRISRSAREDPGTSGDEGEENWRQLLTDWLPGHYHVVTKGRIIRTDGSTTPQMDVLVLSPSYPKKFVSKKKYFAGGVVAAFECKNTLRPAFIAKAMKTAKEVKKSQSDLPTNLFDENHSPIIYGLLAHSHSWKRARAEARENVSRAIMAAQESIDHPRNVLDVVCVADLGCWTVDKGINIYPKGSIANLRRTVDFFGEEGTLWTAYREFSEAQSINALVSHLTYMLARRDQQLRYLSMYYKEAKMSNSGVGVTSRRILPNSSV